MFRKRIEESCFEQVPELFRDALAKDQHIVGGDRDDDAGIE